jgi:predicted nucleic acid-binding Zn ribbon protein
MSFTPLGDALQDKMKSTSPLKKQVEASEAVEAATAVIEHMFPADLVGHAKPLFLKNRTLTVTCASSTMAQEIRLRQAELVDNINKKLGKNEVDRIRYLA